MMQPVIRKNHMDIAWHEYTDENAAFQNKLFSLAVENKINFTDRTGKGYATFTAKDTARYRIEINDCEDDASD